MPGIHKKGRKVVCIWIPEDLVEALDALAERKNLPRSIVMENLFRARLGLPPIDASKFSNRLVRRKKK